jgi:hypothetical protein
MPARFVLPLNRRTKQDIYQRPEAGCSGTTPRARCLAVLCLKLPGNL